MSTRAQVMSIKKSGKSGDSEYQAENIDIQSVTTNIRVSVRKWQ